MMNKNAIELRKIYPTHSFACRLPGFKRVFSSVGGMANLVIEEGETTHAVVHRITEAELKSLEGREPPSQYICAIIDSEFQDSKILSKLKNIRGLKYFLSGCIQNQKEISEFVKKCKIHEDGSGYLQQDFFESSIHTQAKFISGIFTNMIFKIISKKNNKLRIRVGNIITTINNKSNYQYRTV